MAIPADHKEIEKQEKRIGRYAKKLQDDTTAIFYGCIEFDVPFYAAELAVGSRKPWESYLFNLQAADAEEKTHSRANGGFLDGELTMEAANARKELTAAEYRKRWGTGNAEGNYTKADFERLEDLYSIFTDRLKSAGGPDAQQEHILRLTAKMTLEQEHYISTGQVEKAQKLNKMIQDNLSSENLRKKDEKPVDDIKIDAIIDRMEKAGLMIDGDFVDPDIMFARIFGRAPKYAYTKDAAEQMLLYIINTMRSNDGYAEIGTLPDDARVTDNIHEFAEKPNDAERDSYAKLGLVQMPNPKGGGQ